MIEQVLQRDFVLQWLAEVRSYLERSDASNERRGLETKLSALTAEQIEEVVEDLRRTEMAELTESTGQSGFDPSPVRRGLPPVQLDGRVFLSRSPVISNLQAAIEEYYETERSDQIEKTATTTGRRGEREALPVATDRRLRNVPDLPPARVQGDRRLLGKFEPTDVRWVSAATAMALRAFRGKHAFNSNPSSPEPRKIGNRARLIVVGDWGSGLPRAQALSGWMRRELDDGVRENLEQHVIHLGDVYYAGWDREYRNRFLNYWPVKDSEKDKISSWTLNGNHDMYSGGFSYYTVGLEDARFKAWHNGSSFFSCANDNWILFGLDTAYDDFDLRAPQSGWVKAQIAEYQAQKVLLFSHHQLFSAYEPVSAKLQEKIAPVLGTGRITSWFWGHEHRCVLYNPNDEVQYARCIGHGGVPVYMFHGEQDQYPLPAKYEYRRYIDGGLEHWAIFGFAVLDFEGKVINVKYVNEFGEAYKTEQIS
jgi:hypothetical protein